MLEKCLQLRRRLGNPVDIAATLSTLSLARLQGGDVPGATECEEEALSLFRQLGDRSGEQRVAVQVECLGDALAVLEDLGPSP